MVMQETEDYASSWWYRTSPMELSNHITFQDSRGSNQNTEFRDNAQIESTTQAIKITSLHKIKRRHAPFLSNHAPQLLRKDRYIGRRKRDLRLLVSSMSPQKKESSLFMTLLASTDLFRCTENLASGKLSG
ncbi:hypothetical protein CEXT_408941 [Caerostris extrusa]|uniref:Uncharacterized protein n=1 Tax=Caerostris extrusa TaxID=172846 RepID=A0AAV4NT65_CAEEX|nr:hypothetical protein CEXT_408941 [Caerostris extrusa]